MIQLSGPLNSSGLYNGRPDRWQRVVLVDGLVLPIDEEDLLPQRENSSLSGVDDGHEGGDGGQSGQPGARQEHPHAVLPVHGHQDLHVEVQLDRVEAEGPFSEAVSGNNCFSFSFLCWY